MPDYWKVASGWPSVGLSEEPLVALYIKVEFLPDDRKYLKVLLFVLRRANVDELFVYSPNLTTIMNTDRNHTCW